MLSIRMKNKTHTSPSKVGRGLFCPSLYLLSDALLLAAAANFPLLLGVMLAESSPELAITWMK